MSRKSRLALFLALTCASSALLGFGCGVDSSTNESSTDTNVNSTNEEGSDSGAGSIIGTVGMINTDSEIGKSINIGKNISKAANIDLTALEVKLDGEDDFKTNPDATGKFSFTDIPVGNYQLSIEPYEQFPLQAYYPNAYVDIEDGQILTLSIPVVRAIPLNTPNLDIQTLEIDSLSGAILLHDGSNKKYEGNTGNTLLRVFDNGSEDTSTVQSFSNIYGAYLGKVDNAGLFYTEHVIEESKMYDYSWGSGSIGTIHDCRVSVLNNTFDANAVQTLAFGNKDIKNSEWSCGTEICYSYNDEANCPISYSIDNVSNRGYFLTELTDEDKVVAKNILGFDSGRILTVFDGSNNSIAKYIVAEDAGHLVAGNDGTLYIINTEQASVDVLQGTAENLQPVNNVSFYKNGIQSVMFGVKNPKDGNLFVIYRVNKVGTDSLEPWLLVLDNYGAIKINLTLFAALGGDPEFNADESNWWCEDDDDYETSKTTTDYCEDPAGYVEKVTVQNLIAMAIKDWPVLDCYNNESCEPLLFSPVGDQMVVNGVKLLVNGTSFNVIKEQAKLYDYVSWLDQIYFYDYLSVKHVSWNWNRNFMYAPGYSWGSGSSKILSIKRYSSDNSDLDVDVGLMFINNSGLLGLAVNQETGRIYTYDPNAGELFVLE